MIKIITYLTMLFTGLTLQAQNTIDVTINGFENNDGQAIIGLYNSEKDFLKTIYKGKYEMIKDKKVNFQFNDVPDGTYAVSVFHDENKDGKLNMTLGFIPSEDYGNSNNNASRFGPPKWKDATFTVKNGEIKKIEIDLL